MPWHFTLNLKTLRRISDQDVKSGGDGNVSLVDQELVLSNVMNTVALKLVKHSIKTIKNKDMQKTVVGMGRGYGRI